MKTEFVVIGSGKLAVKIAEYLSKRELSVKIIEKKISSSSSVEMLCRRKNLPYECLTSKEITERLLNMLSVAKIKVISAVNTYIFPASVVEHRNFCGINYHNALLPRHRGMNAEAWAIFDMDEMTGITWHYINVELDKGKIIDQKSIPLDKDMTSIRLLKKQMDLAYQSFLEFADDFIKGSPKGVSQEGKKGELHYIKDVPNDGFINHKWSTKKILSFLRAMDYGKLFTMGEPKIIIGSDVYTWDRYRILDRSGEFSEGPGIFLKDGDIRIVQCDCGVELLLENATKENYAVQ